MKVYISGVISKSETLSEKEINANLQRFEDARLDLIAKGHDVFSPPYHIPDNGRPSTGYLGWVEYMRKDIAELLTCDAIYPLPGWEESRGARLEMHIARELGLVEL